MSVFLMASVPYPNMDLYAQDPSGLWNLVVKETGLSPQGWICHQVVDCQSPQREKFIGQILCRTAAGTWKPVAPTDQSDNGIWFQANGALASYNPEPGGVVEFRRSAIPNA